MKTDGICNDVFLSNNLTETFTQLSQAVWRRFREKEYSVVSIPKGMEVTDDGFNVTEIIPTIAVIDVFSDFGKVKIASKTRTNHGSVVAKYAVHGLESKIGLLAFDMTPKYRHTDLEEFRAMSHALKDLLLIQRQYHNITVLNLSVGMQYSYDELSDLSLLLLNSKNVHMKKEELLKFVKESKIPKIKLACEMIQFINALVAEGVEVYIASGNMGDRGLDLLTLSRAQHIVSDPNFEKGNKAFNTECAPAIHYFTKKYDQEGNLAEITDDIIRFLPDEITTTKTRKNQGMCAFFFPERKFALKGTSYSAPLKLNEDIRKILL